jgi:hypothetical protein
VRRSVDASEKEVVFLAAHGLSGWVACTGLVRSRDYPTEPTVSPPEVSRMLQGGVVVALNGEGSGEEM